MQDLVVKIPQRGLATPIGATRHQLFVDPRIPYTSHNSSLCIALDCGSREQVAALIQMVSEVLETESAPGSDPGLALVTSAQLEHGAGRERLIEFGSRAKREVLDQRQARVLARDLDIHLSAHGGDGGGIIGSVAAIGLHCSGADGLFIWMPGIRDLSGVTTYRELRSLAPIDAALDSSGREPGDDDTIDLGAWVRPVLIGKRAILLLDPVSEQSGDEPATWAVTSKDVVKSH